MTSHHLSFTMMSMTHAHHRLASLLLTVTLLGCASDSAPCLPGARICDGDRVLLCEPNQGVFVDEFTCPNTLQCLAGECVPLTFSTRDTVSTSAETAQAQDRTSSDASSRDAAATVDEGVSNPPREDDVSPEADGNQDAQIGPQPDGSREAETQETDIGADGAERGSETTSDVSSDEDIIARPTDAGEGGAPDDALGADTTPQDALLEDNLATHDSGDMADSAPSDEDVVEEEFDDPYQPTMLIYSPVGHLHSGDIHRVRWHPSDSFALLLSTNGRVLRYDVDTDSVTLAMTLGDHVADIDVAHDGEAFFIVGDDGDESMVWRLNALDEALETTTIATSTTLGTLRSIVRNPAGPEYALGSSTGNNINYLFLWDGEAPGLVPVGFNGGEIFDMMWTDPDTTGGNRAVITSEGWGSIGSHTWYVDASLVDFNGFIGGNPGGAGWQPAGAFGILTGWSSNKLYVFDGSWETVSLPGVGTAASPNRLAWRHDGSRAVVVGRAIGPGLSATVTEIRAGTSTEFSGVELLNASIPNFDDGPYFGDGNVHLLDADWRPGPCDGGLIVGTDSSASSFGKVIRFFDPADAACQSWL